MTSITPQALCFGDTILVAASAGVLEAKRFNASLSRIQHQFDFRLPDSLFRAEGYLAGNDQERADELNRGFRDPDVRAIWIARGGYGVSRILPLLDAAALVADPIPIIGYSDVTALHAWAFAHGVRGIHGPVLQTLDTLDDDDLNWLINLVRGTDDGRLMVDGHPGEVPLEGEAPLLGGNLSLLAHLSGTPFQLQLVDSFLLIEDVGEPSYAIDRYFTQLGHSGWLDGCKGVLVGDFLRCGDEVSPLDQTIRERLTAFNLPSLWNVPVGHGRRNRAFSFGGRVAIEGGSLRLLDGAVTK